MALGTKELLRRVKEEQLVENLCEREMENPEGTGFDLRVAKIYRITGSEALLGEEERFTPRVEKVAEYEAGKKQNFVIAPGEYFLFETLEKVNTPQDLVGVFWPRTTLFRSGVTLHSGICSPGYKGTLTIGIKNNSNADFKIELGARFMQVLFFPVIGGIAREYEGQWQHGRVSSQEIKEKQI